MTYDDDYLEADEDALSKAHRAYTNRKIKKKPIVNIHDKIARAQSPKYDRNASGIPAKGGPNGTHPRIVRKYTTIQPFPETEEAQNELVNKLPSWLEENPTEIMLLQFPLSFGYSPYEFFNYAKSGKNPHFTRYVNAARQIIAARVNSHLLDDPTHLRHLFALNHDESREWELEKRAVSKASEQGDKIIAVIESYPDSGVVPDKQ